MEDTMGQLTKLIKILLDCKIKSFSEKRYMHYHYIEVIT